MLDAPTNVLTVLVVCQRGSVIAHRMETILLIGTVVHIVLQLVKVIFLAISQQLDDSHFVLEVVEDDIVLIKNVEEVGGIVLCLCLVLHIDVLEIAHSVEGGVAKDAAITLVVALNVEVVQEIIDELSGIVCVGNGSACFFAIGEAHHTHTMLY